MTGQLLNNKQINDLFINQIIKISPTYNPSKLQIAQYPLTPKTIWEIGENGELIKLFHFDEENKKFNLKAKKYYLVDILEEIILPMGIVGRFLPSSNIIEKGIMLTSGKIEYPYGQNKEKIRFGLINCLEIETTIEKDLRLAYIQFFDLRGQESLVYEQTEYDKNVYNDRIYDYEQDGPNYELIDEDDD